MTRIVRRRAPEATLSSKLGDIFVRRREAVAAAKQTPPLATARRRTPAALPPATIPADAMVLTDILRRARYEPRPARSGDYLHVSDLLGKCIRKIGIVEKHKLAKAPQRLSLMDLLTFAVGDTIHDVIKERATVGSPSQVWGNWECKCKRTSTAVPCTHEELDPHRTCPHCLSALDSYKEVPMRDEDLKVVGTPDLLFFLAEPQAYYITELKSIAHAQWVELTRPKPEHVLQVLFYWYLMNKLGYRLIPRISVLYITKGYIFAGDPYKEFTIDPLEELHRLEPYFEEARALKASRETGALPPRIFCSSDQAPEAKKCEVCSICFGGTNAAPQKISVAQALGRAAVRR